MFSFGSLFFLFGENMHNKDVDRLLRLALRQPGLREQDARLLDRVGADDSFSARTCALCGSTNIWPKSGGIVPHTLLTSACRKNNIRLKCADSSYLHVNCAVVAQMLLRKRENK